jgi:hypothetical protein
MVRKLSPRWVRATLATSPVTGAVLWLIGGNPPEQFWLGSIVGVACCMFIIVVWPEHVFVPKREDAPKDDD